MNTKRLKIAFSLLLSTIAFGTLGFHFIEKMTFFDGLYMTMITISTVGFQEVKPLSTYGRIIAMLIISTGITIGAYTIGSVVRMVIEGELAKTFGRRKLEKTILKLKDHYIICGYGRIGSLICEDLKANDIAFVIIENDPAIIEQIKNDRHLFLSTDATSEETLLNAGIMKAKGIVSAVRSDADNVYITLTARGLRPDIFILSRASDVKSEQKMKRAGATKVVSPYLIGGRRMAQAIIRPTVVDFIDIAMMNNHLGLIMEEVHIAKGSRMAGKNLIQSNLRNDFGIIIVAIKKNRDDMIFNPTPQELLAVNDILVVLGKKEDILKLKGTI